jgi:hypothetical protein
MGSDVNFLVVVVHNETLLRCALSLPRDQVPEDCIAYPMENRGWFATALPLHVKNAGPIVEIEPLFAVHCVR